MAKANRKTQKENSIAVERRVKTLLDGTQKLNPVNRLGIPGNKQQSTQKRDANNRNRVKGK